MMKTAIKYLFGLMAIGMLTSCQQTRVSSIDEYYRWLNDPVNGLTKSRKVNGIEIQVKFMPSDYLAYQELSGWPSFTDVQKDSLVHLYKQSITLLMILGPDEDKMPGQDIMYKSVASYNEYAQRVIEMNFEMENYTWLVANGKEYKPVLSSMDAVQGLSTKRNILFVFVPEKEDDRSFFSAKEIKFKYDDELFGLGLNNFVFDRNALANIPEFTYWNIR